MWDLEINLWAEAKKQVFGKVGIDSIAGPSEILVLADKNANPEYIAYDLLSQAEHDVSSRSFLITDNADLAEHVAVKVNEFLQEMPRKEIAEKSWNKNGRIFLVENLENEGIELANRIASEHTEIMIDEPEKYIEKLTTSGALFVGEYSPEAVGDYIAGPSHTLPTNGTTKYASGLSIYDFLRKSSIINFSKTALEKTAKTVIRLTESETLQGHGNSIKIRLKK